MSLRFKLLIDDFNRLIQVNTRKILDSFFNINFFFAHYIEKEKEWQGPFFFVQGADCQIGFKDLWTGVTRMPIVADMTIKYENILP